MKNSTFRLVIVLAVISISGILVIQIFWMRKAFDLREKQFTHNVKIALLSTASHLCEINQYDMLPDPIEQLSSNYFIVNLNNKIAPDILESVLLREFNQREINEDFEYGIFDCTDEEMVYGRYVTPSDKENYQLSTNFPVFNRDAYYFGVHFPNKPATLAGEMWIWVFSTGVQVIVMLFFGFTLVAIFRQRKLSEIQKDFINNMTHEFKTPISTIRLSSDVLQSDKIVDDPNRLNQYAKIIQKEANRLQHQVDKVLQMAVVENSALELKKEPCNINDLIQQAVNSANAQLLDKGGEVSFMAEAIITVDIDKVHFGNIIHNLLDNAIKYNDKTPNIQIALKNSRGQMELSVTDNGKGIAPEMQKHIFKKFYRVPTGNVHDVKGFGLGLYYVKMIVEAHGGKITLHSSDLGSTFTLTLPIKHG